MRNYNNEIKRILKENKSLDEVSYRDLLIVKKYYSYYFKF